MKQYLLALLACATVSAESPIDSFLNKHGQYIYQDIIINNEIYPVGTDQCAPRYELIRPILKQFDTPFSVLDLGAAQGYFSFRIAQDYPDSTSVMVEANHTSYYAKHGDMLHDLCQINHHLTNIIFLHRRLSLSDLSYLNTHEHFDVIIALLVVHLMGDDLKQQVDIVNHLLTLGDNVILEVANDVDVVHTAYVEYLSHALNATCLGEVKRHKDPQSHSTGKLYWFKTQHQKTKEKNTMIKKETFHYLSGVYPKESE